jgi:hypothetical protein
MSVTQKWHVKSTLSEKDNKNHNVYKKNAITKERKVPNGTHASASASGG